MRFDAFKLDDDRFDFFHQVGEKEIVIIYGGARANLNSRCYDERDRQIDWNYALDIVDFKFCSTNINEYDLE